MSKIFFSKRIAEPAKMSREEECAFNAFMKKNYKRNFTIAVDDILKKTKIQSSTIVDFGCGAGFFLHAIGDRRRQAHLIGIDQSASMLRDARLFLQTFQHVRLIRRDVTDTSLPSAFADLVVSKDSFHEFEKPIDTLREMFRIVKPGGWIFIQDLRRDMPMRLIRMSLLRQTPFQKIQYASAQASYTCDEMVQYVRRAGARHFKIRIQKLTKEISTAHPELDPVQVRNGFQARWTIWIQK
ncbi:MAG: class I SAM-dependent methyltransferase [bacterium]|nr:class I SAM-dependent methyltransferase [bacterium]